jgi:hypothetical protein
MCGKNTAALQPGTPGITLSVGKLLDHLDSPTVDEKPKMPAWVKYNNQF